MSSSAACCIVQRMEPCCGGETLWKGQCQLSRAVPASQWPLPGGGDLPHRPLPRQGNGAEPAGTEVSGKTNEGWVGVRVTAFSIPALLCSEQ